MFGMLSIDRLVQEKVLNWVDSWDKSWTIIKNWTEEAHEERFRTRKECEEKGTDHSLQKNEIIHLLVWIFFLGKNKGPGPFWMKFEILWARGGHSNSSGANLILKLEIKSGKSSRQYPRLVHSQGMIVWTKHQSILVWRRQETGQKSEK